MGLKLSITKNFNMGRGNGIPKSHNEIATESILKHYSRITQKETKNSTL